MKPPGNSLTFICFVPPKRAASGIDLEGCLLPAAAEPNCPRHEPDHHHDGDDPHRNDTEIAPNGGNAKHRCAEQQRRTPPHCRLAQTRRAFRLLQPAQVTIRKPCSAKESKPGIEEVARGHATRPQPENRLLKRWYLLHQPTVLMGKGIQKNVRPGAEEH